MKKSFKKESILRVLLGPSFSLLSPAEAVEGGWAQGRKERRGKNGRGKRRRSIAFLPFFLSPHGSPSLFTSLAYSYGKGERRRGSNSRFMKGWDENHGEKVEY